MRETHARNPHWLPGLLAAVLISLLLSSSPVRADEKGITIFSLTQQDLNGDGQPDLTIIDCTFATGHDLIYVYDQSGNMRASNDWREATDFVDDVWVYDIGADGTAQLIVIYRVENGQETAYVYDDRDGDGKVSYEVVGTQVMARDSPYWTARIISGSQWFLSDGRVNLNVRVEVDGPLPTFDRAPANFVQNWMHHDGRIDVEFEEIAGDDGVARYALKRLLGPSPPDWGFERTGLYSNEGHYPIRRVEPAFFPFLPLPLDIEHDSRYWDVRYFDLPPRVNIDWLRGQATAVKLPGYPIGNGYHFNDNMYVIKDQVNDVSFESPHAYYDLANDRDAFSDLHIRFFTHPSEDATTWSWERKTEIPWQSIGYDWNLFNPGTLRWDFKMGLGGNHTIDSVVQFPDFAVRAVPFEQLPQWITEHDWKLSTLVAREGPGYDSAEGIYEWQADTGDDPEIEDNRAVEARAATMGYMLGITPTPPDAYFTTTRPGFRAERHFASPIRPYLYFSPLDRKLHLRGAEAGLWNIDDRNMIRYGNLNGGPYLDQWQYFENGELRRELSSVGTYLVYAGEDEVILKEASVPPSQFETLPPRTREEWVSLGQQLRLNRPDFAPADFKAILAQFGGPELRIYGATARGFRPEEEGFRFVLDLQPAFRASGKGGPDLAGALPGSYVVSYQNGFTVEPLSPPILSAHLTDTELTQLQPRSLPVSLRNDGMEDVPQTTLELWATPPQGEATLAVSRTVTLLAQTSITPSISWAPPLPGSWTLTPKIRQFDGETIVFTPTLVTVLPARSPDPEVTIAATVSPLGLPFAILGLIAAAVIMGLVFSWLWGRG